MAGSYPPSSLTKDTQPAWLSQHSSSVSAISARVRSFYRRNAPFRIYHGSTNATRPTSFSRDAIVDTSSLANICPQITGSGAVKTILVEPNVSMAALVDFCLPHGLIPPVVPEFPRITVGGAFSGTAGESSSFRHGFFDSENCVDWIEMVCANGEVVTASPNDEESRDLFQGAGGTFGTLGVITLLRLKLKKAKPYVKLEYWPVKGMPDALASIKAEIKDSDVDFVDGILFALDQGVIITGKMTSSFQGNVQCFTRPRDPWFYLHAEQQMRSRNRKAVYTPLKDYLFRYDRGAFWTGRYAFRYFCVPFLHILRWMFDVFFKTHVMYQAMHKSGHSQRYIIQDIALPFSSAQTFIEWLDRALRIYPLWLCPLRQSREKKGMDPHSLLPPAEDEDPLVLNIGVWGQGPLEYTAFVKANIDLERKVTAIGGTKWLYAQTFYSAQDFWSLYDRQWYDKLRKKYNASSLPSVYDKVKTDLKTVERAALPDNWLLQKMWSVWPVSGLYGVLHVIFWSEYLLSKRN